MILSVYLAVLASYFVTYFFGPMSTVLSGVL